MSEPGSRSARPVNLLDIYKTLIDLAGSPRPEDNEIDKESLLPSLHHSHNGGIYSIAAAELNLSYPPLRWQTYDIRFRAAHNNGEVVASLRSP